MVYSYDYSMNSSECLEIQYQLRYPMGLGR